MFPDVKLSSVMPRRDQMYVIIPTKNGKLKKKRNLMIEGHIVALEEESTY